MLCAGSNAGLKGLYMAGMDKQQSLVPLRAAQVELGAEQLDVLAILFTCVKVLYVGGATQRTQRLIEVRLLTSMAPILQPRLDTINHKSCPGLCGAPHTQPAATAPSWHPLRISALLTPLSQLMRIHPTSCLQQL